MNDRELANAVVALGVGKSNQIYPDALGKFYQVDPAADWQTSVNETKFVRDWRVAGALMEKLPDGLGYADGGKGLWWVAVPADQTEHQWATNCPDAKNESLPRAIIEACVEALSDGH